MTLRFLIKLDKYLDFTHGFLYLYTDSHCSSSCWWALWSKATQEVNPLLTHNASLTLSMCTDECKQLHAFDTLAHLLLISTGFRQSCEGIKLSWNTKTGWLAKAINEPKSSELTWHNNCALGNETVCTLTVSALVVLPSSYFMLSWFDL